MWIGASRFGLRAAFALLILVVGGCVPDNFRYMEPSASAGKVEQRRGACGGPNDYITFVAPNYSFVEVRLSAAEYTLDRKKWPLVFVLTVRKNVPFTSLFSSDETEDLRSSWEARDILVVSKAGSVHLSWDGGGGAQLPILFPNEKNNLALTAKSSFFEQEFPLSGFSGQTLDVQMPALLIDGKEMHFPPVHFQRTEKLIVTPINC